MNNKRNTPKPKKEYPIKDVRSKILRDACANFSEKAKMKIIYYHDIYNSNLTFDAAWTINLKSVSNSNDSLVIFGKNYHKCISKGDTLAIESSAFNFIEQAARVSTVIMDRSYFPMNVTFPKCTRLRLTDCTFVLSSPKQDMNVLESLLENFPNLESLELLNCTFISYSSVFSHVASIGQMEFRPALELMVIPRVKFTEFPSIKSVTFAPSNQSVMYFNTFVYLLDMFPNITSLSYPLIMPPIVINQLNLLFKNEGSNVFYHKLKVFLFEIDSLCLTPWLDIFSNLDHLFIISPLNLSNMEAYDPQKTDMYRRIIDHVVERYDEE